MSTAASREAGNVAPDRLELVWHWAPIIYAFLTMAVILSLPCFPSHDGPVHLYYADILRGLLTHSGPYPQYFEIKSWVTPHMLEYFSLLVLELVFPALVAEKILVCVYVLLFTLYRLSMSDNRYSVK